MSDFKKPTPTLSEALGITEDQFDNLGEMAKDSVMGSDLKTDALLKAGAKVKLDTFFSEAPLEEYEKKLLLVGMMIGESLAKIEMINKSMMQMVGGLVGGLGHE
jgi:hypothetical protein